MTREFDPYSPEAVRAVLQGHRGLHREIEPNDESLPCGEVNGTLIEGDGIVLYVQWDDHDKERAYRLTAAPAEDMEE